jgi:hypothetical protein
VLQEHLHTTRDGAYIDSKVTRTAAAGLKLDQTFAGTYDGQAYAQPLFFQNWKPGQDALFIVTDENEVAALDAKTGGHLWAKTLGPSVPPSSLPCHQLSSQRYGILSTPVIDAATRTLYTEAFISPDNGTTKQHLAYALSIDDGNLRPGWPVDIGASVKGFQAFIQHNRGSLLLLGGNLYLPFSGLSFDCAPPIDASTAVQVDASTADASTPRVYYHGWVIGISTADPTKITTWSTAADKGGIWGALTSDGTSLFFATGNTAKGTTTWGGGEAVFHLPQDLVFSGSNKDYFVPSNWQTLDQNDEDLGASSMVLFDLPDAGSGSLAVAMGKAGIVYLVDRTNLGGLGTGDGATGEGLYSARLSNGTIQGNPATYLTAKGRYVVLRADLEGLDCPAGTQGDLMALKIAQETPPKFSVAWCASLSGQGSPMVTTTDGQSDPVVWISSAQTSNLLLGFDGDTGQVVFDGGGYTMNQVLRWTSPIVANGRLYVGANDRMYAFDTP